MFRLACYAALWLPVAQLAGAAEGASGKLEWRIAPARFGENDPIVYGASVRDFGAVGDGKTDDTEAFRQALRVMGEAGGGTVFAPEGFYAIRGTLSVPSAVTLRGEWADPERDPRVRGTVLQVYAGRGQADGTPFITLQGSAGVTHLSLWHPEQQADAIAPYPFTIDQAPGDNATVKHVTLVNPYQGIRFAARWNELHYAAHVRGAPLSVGIEMDGTTDIGRLEDVRFSPKYWARSGLPGAPKDDGALREWLRANGTGIRMFRSDWEYSAFVEIEGYRTGLEIASSRRGAPNAQFYGWRITDCEEALHIAGCNAIGLAFTRCEFQGATHAVRAGEGFTTLAQFQDCRFDGVVASQGRGTLSFQHCSFAKGAVRLTGGALTALDCDFQGAACDVELGEKVVAASLQGNRFSPAPRIQNQNRRADVNLDHTPLKFDSPPKFEWPAAPRSAPEEDNLMVVTDPQWGARRDGKTDDAAAIQKALDAAVAQGGGIVFLPGGHYAMDGGLTVPPGVQLRGVCEVPHHSMALGSVLHVRVGKGRETGPPFIALKQRSSLRGVTIHYPEQSFTQPAPYPFAIQGQGGGISIVDVTASNPYQFVDLATHRCDNHWLDYLAGAPLRVGLRLGGGSRDGVVGSTQFNPHYWGRLPLPGAAKGGGADRLWTQQKDYLEAFEIGDVQRELLMQNFVFGARHGIRFIEENGRAAVGVVVLGHGTDGAKVSARIDKCGPNGVDFINAELVCLKTDDKVFVRLGETANAPVRFFNTLLWGQVDTAVRVDGGELLLQQANFLKHGDGLKVSKGKLRLVNSAFRDSGVALTLETAGASVQTCGNVSQDGLRLIDRAPNTQTAGRIVQRGDVRRRAPLPPALATISALLDKTPLHRGVEFITAGPESRNEPTVKQGVAGWRAVGLPGDDSVSYMYFKVDHADFESGAAPRVEIRIRYFDEGQGAASVVYDSSDKSVRRTADRGAWKKAGEILLGDSGAWRTAAFAVGDARFAHRCNGNDLRLEMPKDVHLVVGELTISRKP